jgi:hypothetical protein
MFMACLNRPMSIADVLNLLIPLNIDVAGSRHFVKLGKISFIPEDEVGSQVRSI